MVLRGHASGLNVSILLLISGSVLQVGLHTSRRQYPNKRHNFEPAHGN